MPLAVTVRVAPSTFCDSTILNGEALCWARVSMKAVVVSVATTMSSMRHVAVTWMFSRAEFVWFVTSPAMTVLPPAPAR